MKQEVLEYSGLSKFLHWLLALLVISMLSISFFLDDFPKANIPTAFMIHKSIGLTILFLTLIRLFWILHKGKPALPLSIPRWQRIFAHSVQHSLYLLLILMPLSGWIMSVAADRTPTFFNLFPVPFPGILPDKALASFLVECHEVIAWIIILLLFLHVAAAFKHFFINKDGVFQRMLPK